SVSASLGTINQGQTSSLTSSAVSTGTSPYTYQWLQKAPGAGSYSSINGATSSSYPFTTTSSTATGSWSFELQVTDATSAVVTSNSVSVTVNAVPTVSVSPTSWTMDVGQSKTFSATPGGGSGSYSSYKWYVGGVVQSGATSTFSYAPGSAGSYSITVTVTDNLGTTSAPSSAASVTVNASPIVSIAPIGPLAMNVGQNQAFTATRSGGSGTIHYQWYLDSSTVGTDSTSYSYTATGTSASVTCKVTDSASTPVTSPASNAVSVTVNPALVAPSVSASLGTINQGQTSSLTSSAVSTGTSPYTYQWLQKAPGAGSYLPIGGATSNSYSFITSIVTATGSWNFILQVKDSVGAAANSSTITVTVNIPPLDHFVFSSISTQTAGTSFIITITAKDASNNTLTNYLGTNTLNVSTGTISPVNTGAFSKGVWTGSVTVTGAGLGITIFTAGSSMSGTSSIFTVNPGALNSFNFSPINSPQTAGSAFSITVTAKDAYGNNVIGYVGTPTLTYSTGSISPSIMSAFINGVGSTSITVDNSSSGVTITATDGTSSGTSNSFTVTSSPAPSPTLTPTPNPTSTSTSSPTSTNAPKSTPTPTTSGTPSPSPTPVAANVTAISENGTKVNLSIRGNVTSLQMSNVNIATSQSGASITVSFTVTGESGTTGFSIITIPKVYLLNGATPDVFIDGQQAINQGYTQDLDNFYVWYTTEFSTHQVAIHFIAPLKVQTTSFVNVYTIALIVPEIVLVYMVIAVRRLRRRPENT
ncbi:MAG TPA: PKD domain-containing protein, partial [Candidatus Binatia bacterium]|nr:PKD domain-containing protein [Candidatus Binatia bacterium]